MSLGELTQVLEEKCEGRERHLRQTETGKSKAGVG